MNTNELTTGHVSCDEAREILTRFVASHFHKSEERTRISIPANPGRDDDIRLAAFIDQAQAARAKIDKLEADAHNGSLAYIRVMGERNRLRQRVKALVGVIRRYAKLGRKSETAKVRVLREALEEMMYAANLRGEGFLPDTRGRHRSALTHARKALEETADD